MNIKTFAKNTIIRMGFRCLQGIVFLPHPIRMTIGRTLGYLAYFCSKKIQHVTNTNIRLCYPRLSSYEQKKLARASCASTGMGVIEAGMAWYLPSRAINKRFKIIGRQHVVSALQDKRGIIFYGLHLTSAELAGRYIAELAPLSVMYQKAKNPILNRLILKRRSQIYHDVVPSSKVKKLIMHLKKNELIWYAPDQAPSHKRRVFVPLFGINTSTATTTSELAKLSDATVVPVAYYRDSDHKHYTIVVHKPLEKFPSHDPEDDAKRLNLITESIISEHPEQYLWQYKRFKFAGPDGKLNYYDKPKS